MNSVTSTIPSRQIGTLMKEDPAPGAVGHDKTAHRRPHHRADQRRDAKVGHRGHEMAFRDRFENHQAPDRHHHRAAAALQDTRGNQFGQRLRQAAQHRSDGEDHDCGAEHRAGAEAVRHPGADRDEHRQAQQVGGDRQVELDRVLVQRPGHRGQRRRDDCGVEQLHEQGAADDDWNEDLGEGFLFGRLDKRTRIQLLPRGCGLVRKRGQALHQPPLTAVIGPAAASINRQLDCHAGGRPTPTTAQYPIG